MVHGAETLAGRYELLEVIGRGGMGVVYRARDRVLDRTVAVKVLPAEYAEDRTLVERFVREARAAARLSHPNIVAVFDSGRDGTVRYIVMECVPGASLAALLAERGAFGAPEAVETAAQVASALAAAHAVGIVHRDIKPGNVMVQPSGTSKVLDFGIASAGATAALTRTAMVLGSAPYISPEVALGESADARSDIYSLGCVLYEMLTGRPPFVGDVPAAVMNQHTSATPRPPRELEPAIPAALDALIMRMLAKDPAERPQPAAELVRALSDSLHERARPAAAAPASPPAPAAASEPSQLASARGSSRRAWVVLGAVLVAVLAGAALALVGSSSPRRTTPAPIRQSAGSGTSSTPARTHQSTSTSTATSAPPKASTSTTTTPPKTSRSAPTTSTGAPAHGTTTHP